MMRITIGWLAKVAGVSKTTISRVINNKPDVDPATREKILALINQYGFQPNAFAKAISLKGVTNKNVIYTICSRQTQCSHRLR